MNLQLLSTRATKLSLEKKAPASINVDRSTKTLELKLSNAYAEEDVKTFLVLFSIKMELDDDMVLDVDYEAEFELDVVVSEEFKNSKFPVINAPAIAYPFLRALISNTLLNAGYEPVLLPSVNFVALNKQHP